MTLGNCQGNVNVDCHLLQCYSGGFQVVTRAVWLVTRTFQGDCEWCLSMQVASMMLDCCEKLLGCYCNVGCNCQGITSVFIMVTKGLLEWFDWLLVHFQMQFQKRVNQLPGFSQTVAVVLIVATKALLGVYCGSCANLSSLASYQSTDR